MCDELVSYCEGCWTQSRSWEQKPIERAKINNLPVEAVGFCFAAGLRQSTVVL